MRASAEVAIVTIALFTVPEAAMSGEAERQRDSLTVLGETVETEHRTEDRSHETASDIADEELSQIERSANEIQTWSHRYLHGNVAPGQPGPAVLDLIWRAWLADEAPDRASSDEAIRVLGSAFGRYLAANLGMRWVRISDRYGRDVCVRSSPRVVTVCPQSVVAKRIESGGVDFFAAIFKVTQERLADS